LASSFSYVQFAYGAGRGGKGVVLQSERFRNVRSDNGLVEFNDRHSISFLIVRSVGHEGQAGLAAETAREGVGYVTVDGGSGIPRGDSR
jgi:hypothetical protein